MKKIETGFRLLGNRCANLIARASKSGALLAILLLINLSATASTGAARQTGSLQKTNQKKMNILILGAAGQVGKMLTDDLLKQTDDNLILYARNANKRLKTAYPSRVKIIDGDFNDRAPLSRAMENADIVYLNDMNDYGAIQNIISVMKEHHVKRIIVASIVDIYGEAKGKFGQWNERMVGKAHTQLHARNASLVEVPELDYTILRLTWLYNAKGNKKYMLTQKGEDFKGTQVTRQAVAQLITDIVRDNTGKFIKKSLGVSEPNTDWDKPSFY